MANETPAASLSLSKRKTPTKVTRLKHEQRRTFQTSFAFERSVQEKLVPHLSIHFIIDLCKLPPLVKSIARRNYSAHQKEHLEFYDEIFSRFSRYNHHPYRMHYRAESSTGNTSSADASGTN